MIAYWFYYFISGVVIGATVPFTRLPDVSLPLWFASALFAAGNYISIAHQIMPLFVDAMFAVLVFILIVEGAIWTYKLIKWGYQKIPGIN